MRANLENLAVLSKEKLAENTAYFKKLRKKNPKKLDVLMQDLHEKEFNKMDCLSCGNCCKTTSPIFTEKDIKRIAKSMRMKERQFIDTYLQRDEDDFMVLKQSPCAFFDERDNTCAIYHIRPKACSEYPHTNRRKFIQITNLTLVNSTICPAVVNILEMLKERLPL
ncbi:YkgJ family cysteine cluster protein [Flavobacteriaceae bacterium F08102]|nr:YkgJ family cysteine cluster protein [Flavobacteriaceae bacterium F08102]